MREIDWFFDFISPFAYLQNEAFHRLPKDVTVKHRPVLLAGLLNHWGQRGPAEIPLKRQFTYRHVLWQAQTLGIPMKFPPSHPFNPLPALRLCLVAGNTAEAVSRIFRFIWREGGDLADPQAFTGLARDLGIDDVQTRIADPNIKNELRTGTEDAIAKGVFGVPTFRAGDELFWGFDATRMLIDFLQDPDRFSRDEFARVRKLPVSAARI